MPTAQLKLIDTEQPWKLDRQTVEVGLAGIARARAALAAATSPGDQLPPTAGPASDLGHRAAA